MVSALKGLLLRRQSKHVFRVCIDFCNAQSTTTVINVPARTIIVCEYTPFPDTSGVMVMHRNVILSMAFVAETSITSNVISKVYFHFSVVRNVAHFRLFWSFCPWSAHLSNRSYLPCQLWHSFNRQPIRNKNKRWLAEWKRGKNDLVHLWATLKVFKTSGSSIGIRLYKMCELSEQTVTNILSKL